MTELPSSPGLGPAVPADTLPSPLEAIGDLRSAARWTIAAAGAVGVAVIGGGPLVAVGKVHGLEHAVIAAISMLVGLAGVGLAIWQTSLVLVPPVTTAATLREESIDGLREMIEAAPSDYFGLAATGIDDLLRHREIAANLYRKLTADGPVRPVAARHGTRVAHPGGAAPRPLVHAGRRSARCRRHRRVPQRDRSAGHDVRTGSHPADNHASPGSARTITRRAAPTPSLRSEQALASTPVALLSLRANVLEYARRDVPVERVVQLADKATVAVPVEDLAKHPGQRPPFRGSAHFQQNLPRPFGVFLIPERPGDHALKSHAHRNDLPQTSRNTDPPVADPDRAGYDRGVDLVKPGV